VSVAIAESTLLPKAPVLLSPALGQSLPEFTPSQEPYERRMPWLKVPYSDILALYQTGPLRVQRNHLRRVRGADHLKRPLPLHANFLAVRLPDGSVQLADGYTRVAASELQLRPAPPDVWLGIVDVNTLKEAEHIYLAVDSRRAVMASPAQRRQKVQGLRLILTGSALKCTIRICLIHATTHTQHPSRPH